MSETVRSLLDDARRRLAAVLPQDEAGFEAQLLTMEALGVNRAWLIAHQEQALTAQQHQACLDWIARREAGEPVAYIVGHREFYGLDFHVTPDVLIPRPDTETLVEAVLARIPSHGPCRVLDLGTGSGAIAIAIARQRPEAQVTALDASEAALAIASHNARTLDAHNLTLLHSDWFDALPEAIFDVIVSNPPYIAAADPHLSQGDLRFEPAGALASGSDGLDDIRRIVATAPQHLEAGGWLILEHGYDQAAAIAALMAAHGYDAIGHATDLAGIQRVTLGNMTA